jgi:hypothetical protein
MDGGAMAPATMVDAPASGPPPGPDGALDGGVPVCETPSTLRRQAGESCVCDNECATGFCQEGACCTGNICGRRAPGEPCQRADQCDSGHCADGVCCNVACTGSCVSCNQPDRTGECIPVPAGQMDPHEVCRRDTEESCGLSGFCNGQGGCARYASGTACGVATCSGPRTFVPEGECDGEGLCIEGQAIDCTPFTCEANDCRSSCLTDTDCVPPSVCAAGQCGLRGKGQSCGAGVECESGFCVDGVCCDSPCTGRCSFCASPSTRGICSPVRAGAPDPRASVGGIDPALVCRDQGPQSCGTNGLCDGQGSCQRYEDGTSCRAGRCEAGANAETGPSVCISGICRAPEPVDCSPFRGCAGNRCINQCGSDAQCASGFRCIDGTCGRRPIGGQCSRAADCNSGICAQGRCCSTACDSPCVACNLAGRLGTCSPVMAGTENEACGDPRCSACDGRGQCVQSVGAPCGAPSCGSGANRNAVVTPTCNAAGHCLPMRSDCPPEEVCRAARCACPPGRTRCGTTCVDLDVDPTHCGNCNSSCRGTSSCNNGNCVSRPPGQGACLIGSLACDGDCINPLADPRHCGSCNNSCLTRTPPQICVAGACVPFPVISPP